MREIAHEHFHSIRRADFVHQGIVRAGTTVPTFFLIFNTVFQENFMSIARP
jgi:hypothetical protein